MALYRGSSPDPNANIRFDGLVWDKQGPGSRLRVWTSPREHPSNQFTRFDQLAKDTDARYDALSAVQQEQWETAAAAAPTDYVCPWDLPSYLYYGRQLYGADYYRAVNLSRAAQDLPPTNTPPAQTTAPANDTANAIMTPDEPLPPPPLAGRVEATWSRTAPTGAASHIALVYARPRATLPAGAGQTQKYRFIGWRSCCPEVPFDITDLLIGQPYVVPGAVISIQLGIANAGGAPFAWLRCNVRNVEEPTMQQGAGICQGRLTLQSGIPVRATDLGAQETLYFCPFKGDRVALWDGYHWNSLHFDELSLALADVVSGKNHDVFIEVNACILSLSLGAAWTNNTTRDHALAARDGVLVDASDHKLRYLGTIRGTATGQTDDTARQRFVANYMSRVPRTLYLPGASYWSYTATAWRLANNGNADGANHSEVQFVIPGILPETPVQANVQVGAQVGGGGINSIQAALGLDGLLPSGRFWQSNAGAITQLGGSGFFTNCEGDYQGQPGIGYHVLNWLEGSDAAGNTLWLGSYGGASGGGGNWQYGIRGTILT